MRNLVRGLLRPSTFLPIVFVLIAFALAQMFLTREYLMAATRGTVIAVWSVIATIYAPALYRSLTADKAPKEQYLFTGILVIWTVGAVTSIWAIAQFLMGRPPWMMNHWFTSLCFLIFAASGFFFIKLPGRSEAGWKYPIIAFGIASALIAAMVIFG